MTPSRVCVSVPGKVILMGEHSAVYGRPALVAALGRRVRVEAIAEGSRVELDLKTLGHREQVSWQEIVEYHEEKSRAWKMFAEAGIGASFDEVRGKDPAHVVKVALAEVVKDLRLKEPGPVRVVVDSEIPVGSGFGSSAAVTVAILAAGLRLFGFAADSARIARLALEVERRQHGHPSGIDHSAVLHGGILRMSGDAPMVHLRAANWVREDLLLFQTGTPAESTGEVVASVRRRMEADQAAGSRILDSMERAVVEFETLLQVSRPDARSVCRVIGEFEHCLERLEVVPTQLREETRRVQGLGGAAKISGAGTISGSAAGCLLVYRPRVATQLTSIGVDEVLGGYDPVEGQIGVEGLRIEEVA
jgi:mevalonate kinase